MEMIPDGVHFLKAEGPGVGVAHPVESLVVERGRSLVALVYPDYEVVDRDGITTEQLPAVMEAIRKELNKKVAPYERIDKIQLRPTEFEKTPKRSIKRFLYN